MIQKDIKFQRINFLGYANSYALCNLSGNKEIGRFLYFELIDGDKIESIEVHHSSLFKSISLRQAIQAGSINKEGALRIVRSG